MVITDIKQQQRYKDRYSIYIEKKYSFSLSSNEVFTLGLHTGQNISDQELISFKKLANEDMAKMRALSLLNYRARSRKEVVDYLKRNKYPVEVQDKVINYLIKMNLLDDYKFAQDWTKNRLEFKQASMRQIKSELLNKGIDKQTINEVINDIYIDERSVLKELIIKKQRMSKYQDKTKLTQFLLRKGFSYDKIKEVLSMDLLE